MAEGSGPALAFRPATREFLRQILENPPPEGPLAEVSAATLAHYDRVSAKTPWMSYFATLSGEIVGLCAFVTAPKGGEVEIAYMTFPPREGQGIATTMARHLVGLAFSDPSVSAVVANTAPEANASTRVLGKLGFVRDGIVIDHEIGEAWRWRKPRGL